MNLFASNKNMRQNKKFSEEIQKRILEFIHKERLIAPSGIVLCAISGGADSVVMSHILDALLKSGRLEFKLKLVHINHRMRGKDSDKDALFCKSFAKALGREFISLSFSDNAAKKMKSEESMRNERYRMLNHLVDNRQGTIIATAHHLSDQTETFFMNLLRGSGNLGGLGIPLKRDKIIRPMLCVTRDEIEKYAKEEKLQYVQDKTNIDDSFLRGRIRHKVIAKLKKENPKLDYAISRFLDILSQENNYIADQTAKAFLSTVTLLPHPALGKALISRSAFRMLHPALARRILVTLLTQNNYSPEFATVELAGKFIVSNQNSAVSISGFTLTPWKNFIIVRCTTLTPRESNEFIIKNFNALKNKIGDDLFSITGINSKKVFGDYSTLALIPRQGIKFPLVIRGAKEADEICGKSIGKRNYKVYRRLQKLSVPAIWRPFYPVLVDATGKVLALPLVFGGDPAKFKESDHVLCKIDSLIVELFNRPLR